MKPIFMLLSVLIIFFNMDFARLLYIINPDTKYQLQQEIKQH